ncbi:hypothetical protein PGIGA_G00007470 [Pangasianodon gigas]|uniref:Uncharacterized protein n=1 Tax=Pangasianodon gigas TaxID=30993 RepID=A0ACC5W7B5_PANGG|nr:hypothetical protein [Pangasianodon gigas]
MCIIIKEMSLYWIIGLLALWSGVITAINVTAAPGVGTTTPNEFSAFIISIKITNRIYDDSLEDHQSQNYKILRQDVENLFFETYSFSPSAQYQEIAEMTFSNGSVIANSTVLFGTNQNSGQTVRRIFVTNYQQHPSLMLDLNINYTADQEPIPVPLSLLSNIPQSISSTSTTTSITSPNSHTTTELSDHVQSENESSTTSTTSASPISGSDKLIDNNNATTATAQTHSTTNGSDLIHFASQTTSNSISNNSITAVHPSTITSTMSASSPSAMTVHSGSNISTISSSSPLNTTVHSASNISTISSSSPLNTTVHSASNISTISSSSSSTTTVHSASNISTISSSSSSTTTVHPSSNISAMSASSSSVSSGKTVTQKPTGPEGTDTVATEQGVPGWGIAILVLAAIILFFMLVLIILLLLFWCCWWRQRGFMNVSDPDPMGYYNPDIPMYSTHSTYDSHNGKSLDSDSDRPPKNRTGMYAVNK